MTKLIITSIVLFLISLLLLKKQRKNRLLYVNTIASSILLTIICITTLIAILHGADMETLNKFNFLRTVKAIQNSPRMCNNKNLDKNGNIIIYYRFGCKDCEAIYKDLNSFKKNNNNIYWVATKSNNGKVLLQKYPVSEVPSGIIIQNNNDYTQYALYKTISENEKDHYTIVDQTALNRLLELQKQENEKWSN